MHNLHNEILGPGRENKLYGAPTGERIILFTEFKGKKPKRTKPTGESSREIRKELLRSIPPMRRRTNTNLPVISEEEQNRVQAEPAFADLEERYAALSAGETAFLPKAEYHSQTNLYIMLRVLGYKHKRRFYASEEPDGSGWTLLRGAK